MPVEYADRITNVYLAHRLPAEQSPGQVRSIVQPLSTRDQYIFTICINQSKVGRNSLPVEVRSLTSRTTMLTDQSARRFDG